MARKTPTRRRTRKPGNRPRLAWTLASTGLLVVTGFAVGLLVGAVWETPERVLPLLSSKGQTLTFEGLVDPAGTTEAPPEEITAAVPVRADSISGNAGSAPPAVAAAPPPETGPFSIQVGSFTEPVPAWKLAEQLGEKQYEVYVDEGDAAGKPRWRVRVGPVPTRRKARNLADQLKAREGLPTWILADEQSG